LPAHRPWPGGRRPDAVGGKRLPRRAGSRNLGRAAKSRRSVITAGRNDRCPRTALGSWR
jgi:hypothetical protein